MKTACITFGLLFAINLINAQNSEKISEHELSWIAQSDWKGSYTYFDEVTGKKISIPAELEVNKVGELAFGLNFKYPYEPRNNSKDKVKIGKNLETIDNNPIVVREVTPDGHVKYVCQKEKNYDGKKAYVYYSYILGTQKLSLVEEVQYIGSSNIFVAKSYDFVR